MTGMLVAKGRIGVDAARAMHKLRDHLLADPQAWLCEIVRVATLSRATRVDITFDADDLFVRFDGDPWPEGVLERAAASIGSSQPGGDRRGYLLAVASYAAAGASANVEVFTRTVAGEVESVRLTQTDSSAGAARQRPKDGGPVPSLCLHVEQSLAKVSIGRLVARRRPKELDLLASRLDEGAPTVTINGEIVAPATSGGLLALTVDTEEGLVIEVLRTATSPPKLVFSELGVVVSSVTWEVETPFGRSQHGVSLPIRAVLRRDRLPTNVSRSRVEEDLERRVGVAVTAAAPRILDELRARVAAATSDSERLALEDAIGAIGVVTAVALDSGYPAVALVEAFSLALDLPLLTDAVGRPRSLAGARRLAAAQRTMYLYEGTAGLPADHLPFVHDVFWLRGRTAEAYLRARSTQPYRAIAKDVARGIARRAKALAAAPEPLEVRVCPDHVVVHRVEEDGFRAAIALRAPGRLGSGCVVRAFVDGQPIETLALSEAPTGVPFDAAVEWHEVLLPNRAYDAAERGRGLERVLARLGKVALRALETAAPTIPAHRGAELRALVAAASGIAPTGGVRSFRVWPTVDGSPLSTDDLARLVKAEGGLRTVSPAEAGRGEVTIVPTAPVLIADESDRRALRDALGSATQLFEYGALLGRGQSTSEELSAGLGSVVDLAAAPLVSLVLEGRPAVAMPRAKGVVAFLHRGVVLGATESGAVDGLAIAIDTDAIVLDPKAPAPPLDATSAWRTVTVSLAARVDIDHWVEVSPDTRRVLLERARLIEPGVVERANDPAAGAFEALRAVALFRALEGGQIVRRSAAAIAHWPGQTIPVLKDPPSPPVDDLSVVLVAAEEIEPLEHLSARRTRHAAPLVERLRRRMQRRAERARVLATPPRDGALGPAGAQPDYPVVELGSRWSTRRAAAAVLQTDRAGRTPHVTVLFHGREVASWVLPAPTVPISLLVDLERVLPGREAKPRWTAALGAAASCAAVRLASSLLSGRGRSPFEDEAALSVLVYAATGQGRAAVAEALRKSQVAVPTIQGGTAPCSVLVEDGLVRYGRHRFEPWLAGKHKSPFDAPVLHAAEGRRGALLLELLTAAGKAPIDVTTAATELQSRRASGAETHRPAVRPPPDHPKLRLELRRLRIPGVHGEVDLVGGPSDIELVVGGELRSPPDALLARLVCPLRGTVFVSGASVRSRALEDLAVGLERYLRELAPDMEALPSFVRTALRRHVVSELTKGHRIAKSVRQAALFPRLTGGLASLADVESSQEGLDLSFDEKVALFRALGRRPGPPPTLEPATVVACLVTVRLSRIGEGEIGIRRSADVGEGIVVSHLGIPIATIPRLLGFPTVGALEVATVTRAEAEAGALDPLRLAAIVSAAEREIVAALDKSSAPSGHTLARHFVDDPIGAPEPRAPSSSPSRIAGWLWVPEGPPEPPLVVTPGAEARVALHARAVPLVLPVTGRIFTAGSPADAAVRSAIVDVAWRAMPDLVAGMPAVRAVELEQYLALLSEPRAREAAWLGDLRAQLSSGAQAILRPGANEIALDGGIVVVGGNHPLGRALTRWAPSRVRLEAPRTPDPALALRVVAEHTEPAEPVAAPVTEAASPADMIDPDGAPEPRLLDSLLALFGVHPTWNAPLDHPVVRKLERVLPRLPLPDGTSLAFSRGGRPVRWERGRVVIDPQDPVVLALVQADDVISLAAAIMTEANRKLEAVTDTEERRALVSLLLET